MKATCLQFLLPETPAIAVIVVHQYERLTQLTFSDNANLQTPWGGYSSDSKAKKVTNGSYSTSVIYFPTSM